MADLYPHCKFIRVGLQDCNTGFVNQSTARVPWLNDLSEDDLNLGLVLLLDKGDH